MHVSQKRSVLKASIVFRDGSRTDAKSKIERYVLIINGWKPLTTDKKISTTVALCSKIKFHQSCEFNPYRNNSETKFQKDGA